MFPHWSQKTITHHMTPLETRRKLGRLNCRNDFWDCYGGRAAQLLVNFPLSPVTGPELFAKVNSAQFPFRFSSDELPQVFVWVRYFSYKDGTHLFTKWRFEQRGECIIDFPRCVQTIVWAKLFGSRNPGFFFFLSILFSASCHSIVDIKN